MAVIGIDLGGTKVAAAVFDSVGNILAKEVKLLNGAQGEEVGQLIIDVIRMLMSSTSVCGIEAIGVCVPGIVYSKKRHCVGSKYPGLERLSSKTDYRERYRNHSNNCEY